MVPRYGVFATSLLLTLAACSSGGNDETQAVDNGVIVEENAAAVPYASENASASGSTPASDASAPLAKNAIPTVLRGRWGMVNNDCTTIHGDAKGLLEISATKLTFYESRGTLAKVSEIEPTRLRALYNFEGEGQSWQRDIVLEVQDGGQSLIRREYGDGAAPENYHYTRCAS